MYMKTLFKFWKSITFYSEILFLEYRIIHLLKTFFSNFKYADNIRCILFTFVKDNLNNNVIFDHRLKPPHIQYPPLYLKPPNSKPKSVCALFYLVSFTKVPSGN